MRKLLFLFLLALPAWANIALVGTTQGPSALHATAITQTITISSASNTLVVGCAQGTGSAAPTSVTDTKLNTFALDESAVSIASVAIYHTTNASIGTGSDTVSCNYAAASYGNTTVSEYSGFVASNAKDQVNGSASFGSTPFSGGSITVNGDTWNSTWAMTGGGAGQYAVAIVSYKGVTGKDLVVSMISNANNATTSFTAPTSLGNLVQYNNGGAINSAAYADNAPTQNLPPTLSFSGCPSSGNLFVASTTCTVNIANGTFDGTHSVTLSDFGVLGTFTPSIGSPCNSTCVITPANLATSFTFTYTPQVVGNVSFGITNSTTWLNPSNATYAVTSTDVCSFTAAADGLWSAAANWTASGCTGGGHTVPQSGDSVTITGHHITCGGLCQVGSAPLNNTTYDVVIAQSGATSGELETSSSGTFVLTGNYKLNSSAGASPTSFAILKIDTGGTFIHNNNSSASVQYRGVPGTTNNWNIIQMGTLGDACTFASYSCATSYQGAGYGGGAYPVMWAMNGTTDDATYQIYGSFLGYCGSSSVPCIEVASANASNGYANAGLTDIENNVWQTTGGMSDNATSGTSALTKLTIANNHSVNDLVGWFSAPSANAIPNAIMSTCLISGNYFEGTFDSTSSHNNNFWGGCTVRGNFFGKGFAGAQSLTYPMLGYVNNFAFVNGNGTYAGTFDQTVFWPFHGNYMFQETLGQNYSNHTGPDGYTFNSTGANALYGNICDSDQSSPEEGHCFIVASHLATSSYSATLLDDLAVISASGAPAGSWQLYAMDASTTTGMVTHMDHSSANGLAVQGWVSAGGHPTSFWPSNSIFESLRDNIGYSATTGTLNYLFYDLNSASNGAQPTNVLTSNANVDYNDSYNGTASTLFNGTTSPQTGSKPSPFNGSVYQFASPTASTWTPAHEQSVNPNYINSGRTAHSWAVAHGQASSNAGIRLAMQQCQSVEWCVGELESYIRLGYQPTNLALKGAAHDGYVVGAQGTAGTGWSGTCHVAFTPQDSDDVGFGATGACTFSGGSPVVTVINRGQHYRIATSASVVISQTGGVNGTAGSQTVVVEPSDIGPVPINLFASVAP